MSALSYSLRAKCFSESNGFGCDDDDPCIFCQAAFALEAHEMTREEGNEIATELIERIGIEPPDCCKGSPQVALQVHILPRLFRLLTDAGIRMQKDPDGSVGIRWTGPPKP